MDYDVAVHLMNSFYPKPIEIICFHCQQSAEKAIKAVIIKTGCQGGFPKSHDLVLLLKQIKRLVRIGDDIFTSADILNPYGIASRYPGGQELEARHALSALKCARIVLDWAENVTAQASEGKNDADGEE